MEFLSAVPEWMVWCAAGAAAGVALAAVAAVIETVLELDIG